MPNNPHELTEEVKVKLDDLEAESQAWQADKSDTKTLLEVRKDADMAILKALTTAHQQGVEAERKRIGGFLDKHIETWREPEFDFERHNQLIDYTKRLILIIKEALTERETE